MSPGRHCCPGRAILAGAAWAVGAAALLHWGQLLAAPSPKVDWVFTAGGQGDDIGLSVAVDKNGYSLVAGHFEDGAVFGDDDLTLHSAAQNIFLARLTPSGDLDWVNHGSAESAGEGQCVGVDAAGNAYVVGTFSGTAQFDRLSLTASGQSDLFVVSYDSFGTVLWAARVGGLGTTDAVSAGRVAVGADGSLRVVAGFQGTLEVAGTTWSSGGGTGALLIDYSAAGQPQWAQVFAPLSPRARFGVASDQAGGAYLTTAFGGALTVGGTRLTSSGETDVLTVKCDATGRVVWANHPGGNGAGQVAVGSGVAVDVQGNVVVVGSFSGTMSCAGTQLTSVGQNDIFVIKYDPAGRAIWAKSGGGSETDSANAVAVDGMGNIYVTGFFLGSATFGSQTLTTGDHADLFIAKYDPAGQLMYAINGGGRAYQNGLGIAAGPAGTLFATGYFRTEGGLGPFVLTNRGYRDVWVARLSEPLPPSLSIERQGGQVILAWPADAPNFTLQSRTNFNLGQWVAEPTPPAPAGGLAIVTNAVSGPSKFYRLSQ